MKHLPLYLSILFIFLLLFIPPIDNDLGWHLRYGDYFLQTGQFLKQNILTYFLKDYYWPNSYSLYQIITSILFKLGGFYALSLAYACLVAVGFLLFHRLSPKTLKTNLISYLLVLLIGFQVFNLGWRAQIFTFFNLILVTYILKEGSKKLFFLPVIFLLWTNLHGGFILGFVPVAAMIIKYILDGNKKMISQLSLILLLCFIATFINPFGINVYKEVLHHSQYPLGQLIAEWVPTNSALILVILIVSLPLLSALSFQYKENIFYKKNIFWIVCLATFTFLSYFAQRNIPIWGLFFALALISFWQDKFVSLEKNKLFQYGFLCTLILGLALTPTQVGKTFSTDHNFNSYCLNASRLFPCGAISFLKEHPQNSKNIYAAYEWGGILEWQLPQYKYFVDGRMPAWENSQNKSPYTLYLDIIQAQPDWDEKLQNYGTDMLLIGNGTFLDLELQQGESPWKEVFRDNIAVVYKRT